MDEKTFDDYFEGHDEQPEPPTTPSPQDWKKEFLDRFSEGGIKTAQMVDFISDLLVEERKRAYSDAIDMTCSRVMSHGFKQWITGKADIVSKPTPTPCS